MTYLYCYLITGVLIYTLLLMTDIMNGHGFKLGELISNTIVTILFWPLSLTVITKWKIWDIQIIKPKKKL